MFTKRTRLADPWNPPNRFEGIDIAWEVPPPKARLHVTEDHTKGILARNRSPDVEFDWSVNPYRGCTHACAYCYARTFHELLGFGAGADFERRIVVKTRAPGLLAEAFERPSWRGDRIAFCGGTDGYQPLERRYELTRRCLEVCARYRNPVVVVTRSPLVVRDIDVLRQLAEHQAVAVTVSVPVLDREIVRALEPGAPPPEERLEAVRALAEAGIPVGLSVAPVIPGLNDRTLPQVLRAGREAGAGWAWFSLLRLPGAVEEVFQRRLRDRLPDRADGVWAKLLRTGVVGRAAAFGERMRGPEGDPSWQAVRELFALWHAKLGYGERWNPPNPGPFRRPTAQLGLWQE